MIYFRTFLKTIVLLIFTSYSINVFCSEYRVRTEYMQPSSFDTSNETNVLTDFNEYSPFALYASDEGLYCKDYLKKRTKHNSLAFASIAASWGATIGGIIATAPTVVGPLLIGVYGGIFSTANTVHATDFIAQAKQNRKLGKKIEDSYIKLGLIKPSSDKQSQKSRKRFDVSYGKFVKYYPSTKLEKNEFAEGIVRANEAGWFCSMRTYEKDLKFPQLAERLKAYKKLEYVPQFEKAKSNGRASLAIFKVIFPKGESAAPSDKEIVGFRTRNLFIVEAEEIRRLKNENEKRK